MKRALLFIFAVLLCCHSIAKAFAQDSYYLRDYDAIELAKGTFIQVINTQELSTVYSKVGSPAKFIATTDLYIDEANLVPKYTEFYGYVEKLNKPVVGTNGSMMIKITKMMLPEGVEVPMNGYIYSSNSNIIGGELSEPSSYDRIPHYQYGLGVGSNQFVPGQARVMGRHTVLSSGAVLIIVLTKPVFITRTLTN